MSKIHDPSRPVLRLIQGGAASAPAAPAHEPVAPSADREAAGAAPIESPALLGSAPPSRAGVTASRGSFGGALLRGELEQQLDRANGNAAPAKAPYLRLEDAVSTLGATAMASAGEKLRRLISELGAALRNHEAEPTPLRAAAVARAREAKDEHAQLVHKLQEAQRAMQSDLRSGPQWLAMQYSIDLSDAYASVRKRIAREAESDADFQSLLMGVPETIE